MEKQRNTNNYYTENKIRKIKYPQRRGGHISDKNPKEINQSRFYRRQTIHANCQRTEIINHIYFGCVFFIASFCSILFGIEYSECSIRDFQFCVRLFVRLIESRLNNCITGENHDEHNRGCHPFVGCKHLINDEAHI